jgi:hypothetical protein
MDPDPGGPKICGSYGSGSLTLVMGEPVFKDKKSKRSHTKHEIKVFLTILA